MRLKHISIELQNPFIQLEKRFVPRVPKRRLLKEDKETKRICFSTEIEKCMEAFPDKKELKWTNLGVPLFLAVYEHEVGEGDEIKQPKEIGETVLDANLNDEYWLLNDVVMSYQFIRVKNIKFGRYCRHTGDVSGIKDVQYENEVEDYERTEKATFFDVKRYKRFKKTCQNLGVEIVQDVNKKESKEYFGMIESSRIYNKKEVVYKIPERVNVRLLWYLISEEIKEQQKDLLVVDKFDFEVETSP